MTPTTGSAGNRRIAKNTMFLYMRMLVIMLVTLYTSRVVLRELGVDDYGVYVVVGGVVGLFSFLNNSMNLSTQRYLNYEMGSNGDDSPRLKTIFSTALTIHLCIAGIVLVLCETIGLWLVNTQLVIPEGKLFATNIVYQTSVASFCIIIVRVPFNAAIIAHERMGIYAAMSLGEAVLQLACAFLLIWVGSAKLAAYGCLILGVQFLISAGYVGCCIKKFRECSLRPKREPHLFSEMSRFVGWNMLGSISWVARGQGAGILLNVFFGPAINAAKGIADQVLNAVQSLNTNFMTAVNPQITKQYASGHINEMELLAYRGVKFSCMLIWIMSLPIIVSVNTILTIWLDKVPAYAPLFLILVLIDCFAGTFFGYPLVTSVSATGKIRTYQIVTSLLLMAVLPVSYIAFLCGMAPETILYFNILFTLLSGIARFHYCHVLLGFSWKYYFRYAFTAIIGMMIISTALTYSVRHLILLSASPSPIIMLVIMTAVSLGAAISATWFIGLTRSERATVTNAIRKRLHHEPA